MTTSKTNHEDSAAPRPEKEKTENTVPNDVADFARDVMPI